MAVVVSTRNPATASALITQRTHDYRCSGCGYGITVRQLPDSCPGCGGGVWEQGAWRPFTLAAPSDRRERRGA
jgi:hypothetical protein